MMGKNKKLIIVGAGETAEIAYEYFTYDSEYEVVAFAVEKKFITHEKLYDVPIVEFENLEKLYNTSEYEVFVAVGFAKLNRARTRLYKMVKDKGYRCASYISSHAFVWHNVRVGENTFIFEDSTIQHHVLIGNNVVLWSGNYIGHRTVIEDNCWLAPHNVIAGFCRIGKNSFIGVNATVGDYVTIPQDTVLGAGGVTVKSLPDAGGVYVGCPVKKLNRTAYEQFNVYE